MNIMIKKIGQGAFKSGKVIMVALEIADSIQRSREIVKKMTEHREKPKTEPVDKKVYRYYD